MVKSPIVARINTLLAERGISKGDFFEACGITSATYSQWNTGKIAVPRSRTLNRIADYLGVSAEYLRTGDETKKEERPQSGTPNRDALLKYVAETDDLDTLLVLLDAVNRKLQERR